MINCCWDLGVFFICFIMICLCFCCDLVWLFGFLWVFWFSFAWLSFFGICLITLFLFIFLFSLTYMLVLFLISLSWLEFNLCRR